MHKKIVVFGGSGFIGSHVADALTSVGHTVTIFDLNKSAYLKSEQRMFIGDILDEAAINEVVKDCDVVYHFAGIADMDKSIPNPVGSVKINILGTTFILDACHKAGIERFIFASSLYVYSKKGSFYRSTKQACEILIENYGEVGLPYTILRYGSLYGERADESNPVYRILKQAVVEGKITREGDGEALREYINVKDAAKWAVEILSDDFINKSIVFTGHQQMKIKDFLLMIKEMFDGALELEFIAAASSDHYKITPYSFIPKVGERFVSKTYIDLGQGILDCMYNINTEED